jgi:UDP-N-acetylmuramate dehydrogenase
VNLRTFTTLKAGGNADHLEIVRSKEALECIVTDLQQKEQSITVLGWGSNVLPSDDGIRGTVVINNAQKVEVNGGLVIAESGAGFQDVFLTAAQHGLGGLEFAVGIPGTLGGALVSNAGAYRNEVSTYLTRIRVAHQGKVEWKDPDWMEFSYRDSILRRPDPVRATITQVELKLPQRASKEIYDDAREFQRQRIGKQPPTASAGSFFKNVVDQELAQMIPGLTDGMRKNGVIPSGFLIEACGLKGFSIGGAMIGKRHANFLLNARGATATELRSLAIHAVECVKAKFGVTIEEEVLYLGDWSLFKPIRP